MMIDPRDSWHIVCSGGLFGDSGDAVSSLHPSVLAAVFWTSSGSGGSNSKVFNTHVLISESGVIQAAYRKIHLFDVVSQSQEMSPPTPARSS